jgi:metal-responsive CopG/Arc/MetJ family transcriptional regulator
MTNHAKNMRVIQIDMPPELVAKIDQAAAEETLCRTAWMRRTLNEAVKTKALQSVKH